jgi:hypothetical protein
MSSHKCQLSWLSPGGSGDLVIEWSWVQTPGRSTKPFILKWSINEYHIVGRLKCLWASVALGYIALYKCLIYLLPYLSCTNFCTFLPLLNLLQKLPLFYNCFKFFLLNNIVWTNSLDMKLSSFSMMIKSMRRLVYILMNTTW